jgi:hypothetical protein
VIGFSGMLINVGCKFLLAESAAANLYTDLCIYTTAQEKFSKFETHALVTMPELFMQMRNIFDGLDTPLG